MWEKRSILGIVLKYSPRMLTFSDGSRMSPYHNRLFQDAKLLTNLNKRLNATVELLCCVACRYLNTDTCLTLRNNRVVETCYEYTLLLELCCEVL